MKVLITGITGQLGSYVAEHYLNLGYEVIGLTRRVSTDNTQRLKGIIKDIKMVEGDSTDYTSIFSLLFQHKPDLIINCSAQSHVHSSFKQPFYTAEATQTSVLNLLESVRVLKDYNYNPKIYQCSSSEMFGSSYTLKLDQENNRIKFQDENTPFKPQSPYAVAKLAAHNLCRIYRDAYDIHVVCGIMFNYESERRGEKFVTRKITKWIGEFYRWLNGVNPNNVESAGNYLVYNGRSFPKLRLGNINASRDWTHATDMVAGIHLSLEQEKPDDYVFSSGCTHTVKEFLEVALEEIGVSGHISSYYLIDEDLFRPAEVEYLRGYPRKANDKLGWYPTVSFEDLVSRMVWNDIENG